MAETYNFGLLFIHDWEWAAIPLYLVIIFLIANVYRKRKQQENPLYKFYVWGLFAKITGTVLFALIYLFYYHGGDTVAYFESAEVMKNLLFQSPLAWLKNEFGSNSVQNYALFTKATGHPLPYMYFDLHTFTAIRLLSVIAIPAFGSFLIASILTAFVSYWGIWRMYLVFASVYPKLKNSLAFAILFFPSVLFWGSGMLKDTITLSCTGWAVYCIYTVFILKRSRIFHSLLLVITVYLILLIKPYIVIALLPGCLMWIFSQRLNNIRNFAARILVLPAVVAICFAVGYFIISELNAYLGKFSPEKVTFTALVTQNDLHQSYYHGHGFDIGPIENTTMGFIIKSPEALAVGFYRPFLWESDNIVMLLSALENTIILALTAIVFVRFNLYTIMRRIFAEPLLFFSFTYSIFFAFAVGISTSNFGALVRFKIAYIPFYVASIIILLNRKPQPPIPHEGEPEGAS